MSVPKTNMSISSATSSGEQSTLMWTPPNCFYSCCVITKFGLVLVRVKRP